MARCTLKDPPRRRICTPPPNKVERETWEGGHRLHLTHLPMHHPNLLRANRERFALSQTEVGSLLGLTDDTIGNYENAERIPNLEAALGLSLIFGKPSSQLFPDTLQAVAVQMAARLKSLSIKIENETGEGARVRQEFVASLGARLISLASNA